MATIISTKTSGVGGLSVTGDASGILQLASADGTTALTIDASQNVTLAKGLTVGASAAPAFSAYNNATQSATSGMNLIVINTIEFDTATRFNATGVSVNGIPAYAFMPNVAGYYIFTGECRPTAGTAVTGSYSEIWKNGAAAIRIGIETAFTSTAASFNTQGSSSPIYMNGTTDYVQFYSYITGTGALNFGYAGIPYASRFSAFLARSA